MELPWPNPETDERPLHAASDGGQQPEAGSSAQNPSAPSGQVYSNPAQAILDVLRRGERFLVCSHARLDGDAVGSILACGLLLGQMGKQADLVTADHVPPVYRWLPGAAAIRTARRVTGPYCAAILLECDSLERTGLVRMGTDRAGLENLFLINIDHHLSGRPYARLNWIDHEAASVGEMVYRLARTAGATLTPEMATCLYTTVFTDTGGFSYGSLRPSTFELARDLVAAGADPIRVAQEVCYSTPMAKMLLLGAALHNLHHEGSVAWLWLTHEDVIRAAAADEDSEGIVNFAMGIAGTETAAFLRELPDGQIRMSLRGKGKVDVAAIAGQLGGGGHKSAAGCTVQGPLPRALDEILKILREAVAPRA